MGAHCPHSFDEVLGDFWAREEARALCPMVDIYSQDISFVNGYEMVMDG